jgi:hypothetical protein
LKTGAGGGNTSANSSGGNAGSIILQPGSGGAGTLSNGTGGSTIVRASANGSDILTVRDSAGTTTHLGVANNGNVRVGASSATARLHLGAGTSSLAPLKFTAGTNLSSPEAGAMEWDGSKLYMSLSSTNRRALEYSSEVANVLDFGAVGNGTTDDSPAVQAAVNSLVSTGGVVYFPPARTYGIGTTVTISSQYPIWLVSNMGGWNNYHVVEKGYIAPIAAQLTDGMFRWLRVGTDIDSAGGGGAVGLKIMQPFASGRTKPIHSAIRIDNAANFLVRDCEFYYLNGRVIYAGEWANNTYIQHIDVSHCGAVDKPMIDFQTGENHGYYYILDSELEVSFAAPYIRVPVGGVYLRNVGFEADYSITPDQTFIDASNGTITAFECSFRRNQATHVIIGQATGSAGTGSRIADSSFDAATGKTTKSLHVLPSAAQSQFTNLRFVGTATQQAQQIHVEAQSCKLTNIYIQEGGNVEVTNYFCQLTNIHCYALQTTRPACIMLGDGCVAMGCQVDGNFGGTPTHGIQLTSEGGTPKVIGCEVRYLAANKDGIVVQASQNAIVSDNWVYGLSGTGRPYVWASGVRAKNNAGYAVSATAVAGGATLHAESGIIESEPLTTPNTGTYTLLLTNSLIGSASRVMATVQRGTENQSLSYQVQEVFPASGLCWIVVKNTGSVAFGNGNPPPNSAATIKIHFVVQN